MLFGVIARESDEYISSCIWAKSIVSNGNDLFNQFVSSFVQYLWSWELTVYWELSFAGYLRNLAQMNLLSAWHQVVLLDGNFLDLNVGLRLEKSHFDNVLMLNNGAIFHAIINNNLHCYSPAPCHFLKYVYVRHLH